MQHTFIISIIILCTLFKSNAQNIDKVEYQKYRNIITELERNPGNSLSLIKSNSLKAKTKESQFYSNLLFGQYYFKVNVDSSEYYYGIANKIAIQSKNDYLIGLADIGNASIKFAKGDFKGSIELYTKCLNTFNLYKDSTNLAKLYNNIGSVFQQTEQYDKAKEYLQIANSFYKKLNNLNGLGLNYRKLGYINFNQYQFKIARNYYDSAFYYFEMNNDKPGIASMYLKYGDLDFEENKNYKSALAYYQKAKTIYESQKLILDNIFVSESIAEALFMMKKSDEAKKEILSAIELAKKNNYNYKIPDLYLTLHELYQIDNNYKNALEYFKLSQQYKDSIYKLENQNIISELEIKYKTAEKDKEIVKSKLESEQNAIKLERQTRNLYTIVLILVLIAGVAITLVYYINKQKKLNKELNELNQFKNKVLTIISHDVRTPISSIINSSKEQSTIQKGESAIQILDNLFEWSYSQIDKENITKQKIVLDEIIEQLLLEFKPAVEEKALQIDLQLTDDFTFIGDKSTTKIIFRNILSNAIKYSGANDSITIKQKGKEFEFINSINNTAQKGKGIGLKICQELALKNNYQFSFTTKENTAITKLIV